MQSNMLGFNPLEQNLVANATLWELSLHNIYDFLFSAHYRFKLAKWLSEEANNHQLGGKPVSSVKIAT